MKDIPKIRLWSRPLGHGWRNLRAENIYWGFGLKYNDKNRWVHYSFAYHPWYVSLWKTLKHYKKVLDILYTI